MLEALAPVLTPPEWPGRGFTRLVLTSMLK